MAFRFMLAECNLLALAGEAAMLMSPSLDTLTPASNAIDGRPSTPIRWGVAAGEVMIGSTLNLVQDPGFEAPDLAAWPILQGTSERTTDPIEIASGTASLKITGLGVADVGGRYQDVRIPAGVPFKLSAVLQGTGTDAAAVVVLNLDTGRFLDSSGAWVTDMSVRTISNSSASYAEVSLMAAVEGFAETRRHLTRLRLHVIGEAADTFADGIMLRPSWNFVGLFGHNLTARGNYRDPGTPFQFYGQVPRVSWVPLDTPALEWIIPGADGFADGDSYAIPSPNAWNMWSTPRNSSILVTIASDQYGHYPIPTIGELVVGYLDNLVPAGFPVSVKLVEPGQVRNETGGGDVYAYNAGPCPTREVTLRFTYDTDEAEAILRERLYRASRGGADGVILVAPEPWVSPLGCVFGIPEAELAYSVDAPTTGGNLVRTATLTLREVPSPETFG